LQEDAQGFDDGRFTRAGFTIEGNGEGFPLGIFFQFGQLRVQFGLILGEQFAGIVLCLVQGGVAGLAVQCSDDLQQFAVDSLVNFAGRFEF